MQKPTFDPGLTQQYTGPLRRVINDDGSFNITRRGTNWRDTHPYLHLVSIPWWAFFAIILGVYILINTAFAICYFLLGTGALQSNSPLPGTAGRFLQCFFFSSQTLTTLGYGRVSPIGFWSSGVAAIESAIGLLAFALSTSLLWGRFSRPTGCVPATKAATMS